MEATDQQIKERFGDPPYARYVCRDCDLEFKLPYDPDQDCPECGCFRGIELEE